MINAGLIYPKEVVDKYGDMTDWHNSVGTGPFMLTDYVSASQATLVRNPNYWMTDPIGPGKGNQLPYLDQVRWLIIPDMSTQLAAMRTARIDWIYNLSPENATDMRKVTGLKEGTQQPQAVGVLYMRTDRAPFNDVRVRQALTMAINWKEMNDSLYGGLAQVITFPYWRVKGYEAIYMGVDDPDTPDSVKELFTYHPDKAKQLLADAGFPTGFKTNLILSNAEADIDYYSIVKEYWSKIGVDLTLDPRDPVTLLTLDSTFSYDQMITDGQSPPSTYPVQGQFTNTTWVNLSLIRDPAALAERDKSNDLWIAGRHLGCDEGHEGISPVLDWPGLRHW